MSDQFYSYLSEKIVEFFRMNPLTSGAKYNIQFEKQEQVIALYDELKHNNGLAKEFEYKDLNGEVKYRSYLLDFGKIKLIVSATIGDIQPDFLTRLRNMVGVEDGYRDKAILFIHDTTLDSILGGTESFSKEGMPFHIKSIEEDIKTNIEKSNFTDVDKAIINIDLERKKKELFGDAISIFEYKDLLATVNGTCIEKEQYRNFGLFYDSKLKDCEPRELKNRLKENTLNFSRVSDIHNYGSPETQLEKYFDDKGVDKLKGEDWKNVDFKDVVKSIAAKKETKPLEYMGSSENWDKEEGSSKAKSRIRNIIVFNEEHKEDLELEFTFDDSLKKEFLTTTNTMKASTSGKKIKAILNNCDGDAAFHKINYKNDKGIKFEFRIVVVGFNEKYLESIKTKFSIVVKSKNSYILINTNENSIVFNEFATNSETEEINNNYETIKIEEDNKVAVKISDNFEYENDSDLIQFKLDIANSIVPFGIKGTTEKIAPIEGLKVWKLKREKKCDFKFIGDNKLQHGTKEYFARDEFKRNIQIEKEIVESEGVYFLELDEGLDSIELELSDNVKSAYSEILRYYKLSNKLPSLTYLNDELKTLYSNFIKAYINELNNIQEGVILTREQKNLFRIGMIKREIEDREVMLTPFHPLNIVYQLHIANELNEDEMNDDILKKITSTYLLPYITVDENKLYVPMEQFHSPEWKYYVDNSLPRYKSSRNFVSKLVLEKIEEFVGHFNYLFNMANNAPIRINLINTGDSKEILQGIFKYYVKQLKDNKDILPMDLFIYSNKNITNAFEEVAFNDNIDQLKEIYGLDLNVGDMSEEDVLDLYREKVNFYSKKVEDGMEYSHITFIEMSSEIKTIISNMDEIPSGAILNGLISGVPSVFLGDAYRTGFGTKYSNNETDLMVIASKLNTLDTAMDGSPFHMNQCKAVSISNDRRTTLDNIYNSTHWVTFIDPKVDLNFFKNDPGAKDLLIIHYSDQYTTAGGYDAITVTRKSGPYQKVIEEFLTKKGVEDASKYSPNIINMFNAVNGDWLLRLLSSKSHQPKEKISILSAIKLALAKFKKDNVIWVPISLEEVLRVSGGAGLKQSEGFLSAKKLGFDGATSDDILLIGIEDVNGETLVHYYPIEVKIGNNLNWYVQKGIEQAKATKKIFNEILLPKDDSNLTNSQKMYRNFLMQLVITSAEKLNLYDVCNEENWINVIDSDLRRKLLNEEYTITDSFDDSIGEAAVISFRKENYFDNTKIQDNVMVIEMSEDDGFNFITKTVGEIRNEVGTFDIKETLVKDIEDVDGRDINVKISNIESDIKADDDSVYQAPKAKETVTDTPISFIKEVPLVSEVSEHKNEYDTTKEICDEKENRNIEVIFGVNQKNNMDIKWCPNDTNKLMHTNTGIIGTMGTGKTQFTKSMITQIHKEAKYNLDGKDVGILIFDYKGDYNKNKQDFIDATGAKVYELYHLPFNPLTIVTEGNPKPMLPLHTANSLKETLAKAFGLGIKQETLLRDLIMEAYDRRGIEKGNKSTWDKPAPTLKDVYDIYVNKEDLKEDSLYAAFSNLIDFEIFEPDPFETKSLFDLIDGVTVIDLSGYDPGIQNLVVAITLDLFYAQMQGHGHSKIDGSLRQLNKVILVDEADNFLSKNFGSLKKILKEGREFGVGTVLSTQLLSHFSTGENEYANYILSWVIHRVDDLSNKDVKRIFNTQSKQEEENLYNKIKSLNKHYSLVKMGDSDRPIYMKDRAFWELIK